MIAVKREVAALEWQVFRGANVKLKTDDKSLYRKKVCIGQKRRVIGHKIRRMLRKDLGHTRESVQSPLVVLEL